MEPLQTNQSIVLGDLDSQSCVEIEVIEIEDALSEIEDALSEIEDKDPEESSDGGDQSDTGPREKWDPHAGLKLSRWDGKASDGELDFEDNLPSGAMFEMNDVMVKMVAELEDAQDPDWLLTAERKKVAAREKGD
jgi:hypothetical protein